MQRWRTVVLGESRRGGTVLAAFLVACGTSPTGVDPPPTSAPEGTVRAPWRLDAGRVPLPQKVSTAPLEMAGDVVLTNGYRSTGSALFVRHGTNECKTVWSPVAGGRCEVSACVSGLRDGPEEIAHAGNIFVTGGALAEEAPFVILRDPRSIVGYATTVERRELWTRDDQTLHVRAEGGGVPAFFADVPVPKKAKLIAPVVPADTGVQLSLKEALRAEWSGARESDEVKVSVYGYQATGHRIVLCFFGGAASPVTIAAEMLAGFEGYTGGHLAVSAVSSRRLQAGPFTVTVQVTEPLSPDVPLRFGEP